MFGLPQETVNQLMSCFQKYPEIQWVKIYGSRANGRYEQGSDIDLAYSGEQDISAKLLGSLDALPTPYQFDITHYQSIENNALKMHIDKIGIKIYPH